MGHDVNLEEVLKHLAHPVNCVEVFPRHVDSVADLLAHLWPHQLKVLLQGVLQRIFYVDHNYWLSFDLLFHLMKLLIYTKRKKKYHLNAAVSRG